MNASGYGDVSRRPSLECAMPSRLPAAALALALFGCKDKSVDSADPATLSQTWIEGHRYHWVGANHRLSFLRVGVEGDELQLALVGGTSTSGQGSSLDSCDLACEELIFRDTSDHTVHWARYTGADAVFASGSVEALATADGATATVDLALPSPASGDVTVFLSGLTVNTNHPLSGGEACYIPAYGWHVQRIAAEVTSASVSGDTVTAEVSVAFKAGLSLEAIRECVDAVVDQAEVPITLDLVAVVSDADSATQDVAHGEAYGHRDEDGALIEQPDPDYTERPLDLGLSNPIAGWSRLDYTFHDEEGLGRGAYLRDLEWVLDVNAGVASGHATNASFTQLSGFDYRFEGTVVGVETTGTVERGTLTVTGLAASLTEDGYDADPEVYTFPLADGEVAAQP